jgi:hypothetical protein
MLWKFVFKHFEVLCYTNWFRLFEKICCKLGTISLKRPRFTTDCRATKEEETWNDIEVYHSLHYESDA